MDETRLSLLTARDDTSACTFTQTILGESGESDRWYSAFDVFFALLDYPKSLVCNRGLRPLLEKDIAETMRQLGRIPE